MSISYNPFSLEGKTILVTGASSGIGRGTAIECSKMGANVVLSGRNSARLKDTLNQMAGEGHVILNGDLTSENDLNRIIDQMPSLDGIVHCAGISQIKMVKFMDKASLENVFNVNFFGPIMLNSELLKKRKVKKGGSIVFISSISGIYASQIGEAGYGATKAALSGYTKSAAIELAAQRTRVNCIHPGVVETPLLQISNDTFTEDDLEALKKRYPLKRFGKPEDVAQCAIYLLSDASSWMTGSNILLDGGFTLS